ncbi:phosphoserine phosphatase [Grimontia hollisae]|uniref:Phosphoserine phosphatase n=1 Tax=Grimontia hollisae TaxID=673 RepID=A0A377J8U1_GRIHO|nr:phosphoserine phosphatase [Grimontia hollisae]
MKPLTASLQARGWKVAIASGGFTWFSDKLKQTCHSPMRNLTNWLSKTAS